MMSLFFPAVLGTIFVEHLPLVLNLASIPENIVAFLISLSLLIHFCVDFIYTENAKAYNILTFGVDLLILLFLYASFNAVNYLEHREELKYSKVAEYMAIIYGLFIVWNISLRRADPKFFSLLVFEVSFIAFYLWAWISDFPGYILPFAILLSTAILFYFSPKQLIRTDEIQPIEPS